MIKTYLEFLRFRLVGKPFKMNFAVTYECPARCRTCNIWKLYRDSPSSRERELTIGEIKKFAEKNWFPWVSLTGGEPFARKDLPEIARAFSPRMLSVATNGFSPKLIESQVSKMEGRLFVNVSIDGPPKIHEKIRGIEFSKSLETLKRLHELNKPGLQASFEVTLSPWNQGELGGLYKVLESEGLGETIPTSTVTFMHTGGMYQTGGKEFRPVDKDIRLALSRTPRSLQGIVKRAYLKGILERKRAVCSSIGKSFFMNPYGEIFQCIMSERPLSDIRGRKLSGPAKCKGKWTPCEQYQELMLRPMALLQGMF